MKLVFKRIYQIHLVIKYYLILLISPFFYKSQKDTWLLSERGDEARDNALYFYMYLKKEKPNVRVKYVIKKNSRDISMIDEKDRIYLKSIKHYLYFINSKYLISTHHMGYSPRFPIFSILDNYHILFVHGKRVFLQHGIIYNYVASLVKQNIDLFITSSELEKKYVVNTFGFSEENVKCTGLARYDYFNLSEKNYVLVMPTWRRYLKQLTNEEFIKTDYYKNWNKLINDDDLIKKLEKNNLKLLFYPHYEMQKFISTFEKKSKNVIFANSDEYSIHDLLNECKLFITDYSSTFFDVAYLKKPIIFYQFDYKDFYSSHYKEGYLNMQNNDFGISTDSLNEINIILRKFIDNNFELSKQQLNFIESFYKHHDKKNCERIYNEILKIK